jgi:hypothetical protein
MNELEHLESERLFDKIIALHIAEELRKGGFEKRADYDWASLAQGAVNAFVSAFTSAIDTSSTGATLKSVIRFLAPGALWMIPGVGPALAIIDRALQTVFGVSLTDPIMYLVENVILPNLQSGNKVSAEDIKSAVSSKAGNVSLASIFSPLENEGLIKVAAIGEGNFATRLFKNSGFSGLSIAYAIAGFLLTSLLRSVGLLGTGAVVGSALGIKKPEVETKTEPQIGDGILNKAYKNDSVNDWFEPVNGTVENTVYNWIMESNPELARYKPIIFGNEKFDNIVNELERSVEGNYIKMPKRFTTIGSVLKEVLSDIKNDISS